ncbi:MAG: right-handed parallel beta-helix repeat-containing protein [Phycisphaerae bacterium]
MSKSAIVLYVSPGGNDEWSGGRASPLKDGSDGPFRSIARARDAVRELKATGKLTAPVTVYLRGGTYFLARTLLLTPEDSGTESCPITYAAYRGETPVLSGGRRIAGWRKEDGRWVTDVPGVKKGTWRFRQLFVSGERRLRPRLPRRGYFRVAAGYEAESYHEGADCFIFAPGDLEAGWRNLQDIEVVVLHFWVDTHLPVKSIDPKARRVTFTRKSRRRLSDDYTRAGARYYVENVREALRPGEWYLDRKTGRLEYWPLPGERLEETETIAPRLTHLVRLEGKPKAGRPVEHVRFKGLTFSHNAWDLPPDDAGDLQAAVGVPGAAAFSGTGHCLIEGCTFTNLGTYGVDIGAACHHIAVRKNEFVHLGGGGVKISGGDASSPEDRRTSRCEIVDNHIHDGGEIWHSAVGVLLRHASHSTVAHNHIHHLYYTGVSVGWVWGYRESVAVGNRIEFNHIHDIGQGMLSDMGGIYTLGPSPGTVLRNNIIHDVSSHGYGGWGLYTDEGSSNILLENNIVYRTKSGGFHQHYGRENVLRNNIFAFSKTDQIQRSRAEPHVSFTFERNIVYWKGNGPLLGKNWRDDKFRMDRNVYWNASGRPVGFAGRTLDEWRQRGHDVHSLIADPLFVDPEEGDFRLKKDSPALRLGFRPIDTSRVGPRR